MSQSTVAKGEPLRLLVVDDHADTLAMMVRLLTRKGYVIESAGTVAGAKAKAAAMGGSFTW